MLWRLLGASGLSLVTVIAQIGDAGDGIPGPLQDIFVASPFAGLLLWLFLAERKDSREQRVKYEALQEKRLTELRETVPLLTRAVEVLAEHGKGMQTVVDRVERALERIERDGRR